MAFATSVTISFYLAEDALDPDYIAADNLQFSVGFDGANAEYWESGDDSLSYDWDLEYMSAGATEASFTFDRTIVDFSQYLYGSTWVLTVLEWYSWDTWLLDEFSITDDFGNVYSYSGDNVIVSYDDTTGEEGVTTFTITTPVAPIPEPSTFVLFGAGLLGLGYFCRNKK